MRQVRQSPTVATVRRSQTRHKVLMSLIVLTSVVLWLTEDKIATAASGDRTVIRQSVVKSLGWDFTSETEKLAPRDRALGAAGVLSCWKTQYRSKAPYEGRTHLRLDLVECDYSNQSAAQASLKHFLTTAHPDAGHSYEWEAVFVAGSTVFRLIGGCIISRANFDAVSRDLAAALNSNFGGVAARA
jgi:hypothetical protein